MNKTILMTLVALTCCSAEVSAQGWLRQMGERAASAAKEAVEDRVGSKTREAVGGMLGGRKTDNNQGQASYDVLDAAHEKNQTLSQRYNASLSVEWQAGMYFDVDDANRTGEYDSNGDPVLRISKPSTHFASDTEAINALPALPPAKQVLDEEECVKAGDKMIDYHLAVSEFLARKMLESQERGMQLATSGMKAGVMGGGRQSGSATSMPLMNALADKILAAVMQSGLDMEKATEDDMKRIAVGVISKEYGIPEAEVSNLMAMAEKDPAAATAYLKQKYPNAAKKMGPMIDEAPKQVSDDSDPFAALVEELEALRDDPEFKAGLERKVVVMKELTDYANQLLAAWPTSEDCAKVEAMEQELDKQLKAYMESSNVGYNDETPAFWVSGRKAQNAIVQAYNEKMVQQWCAKLQEYIEYFKPLALRSAAEEAKLNQLISSTNADALYNNMFTYQAAVTIMVTASFDILYQLPAMSLDSPRVGLKAETWLP